MPVVAVYLQSQIMKGFNDMKLSAAGMDFGRGTSGA